MPHHLWDVSMLWTMRLSATYKSTNAIWSARAIGVIADIHEGVMVTYKDKLQMVVSPPSARLVRVTKPFKVGELQIAPFTTLTSCTKPGEKVPLTSLDLGYAYTHEDKDVNVYASSRVQPKEGNKPELLPPFWLATPSADASQANVKLELVAYDSDSTWEVPVFKNHKALKVDDVVTFYSKGGSLGRYTAFSVGDAQGEGPYNWY